MSARIVSFGTYLPAWRLDRGAVAEALGIPPGKGTRAVASYDEDATSMAVEAGRRALAAAPGDVRPATLAFATTTPPYADKTNATAVHAALGLDASASAYDMVGSVRSAVGALRAGLDAAAAGRPSLVVAGDVRTGLPGGVDERDGGDGASAFLLAAEGPALAEVLAHASSTAEFLDRWRTPGDVAGRMWEERFGEHAYVPLAEAAVQDACKQAGITTEDIDVLVVSGLHQRAVRRVAGSVSAGRDIVLGDLTSTIGNPGAAQPGILLAAALEKATPGQVIALVVLADGADCIVLRAGEGVAGFRPQRTLEEQEAEARRDLAYATFLTWRGLLRREPPRRPDPERPAAPPSFRSEDWKFGFTGTRCTACDTRHLPPARVCLQCHAVDRMVPERLADVPATVATYTVDRLTYSLNPPVVIAVIDFDGGGRYQCELTDVDPEAVRIGDRVAMTFRRLYTADGVHNYFWKARPLTPQEA
ncbi:MAG TPA: OB-fold domain-containing protein [Acidimicrobiales bacterium]|nr:OB-fold domain-containing protein [Acidimicrobiales bacterium]